MALMCFQASREDARLTSSGNIILLKHQDRRLWNQELIEKGNAYLNASADGDALSEYHLEAAIAACHSRAESFETTDWKGILRLYELLSSIKTDPFVELNKAIVLGLAESPEKGLEALTSIAGLENNSIYHAAMGDFHQQLNQTIEAKAYFTKAISLTKSKSEIELLQEKITSLT
jgi:RNA polymerase sigma-70 factor (ECF subfamily)